MCMSDTWLGLCGLGGSWLNRMCLQNKGGHCLSLLWEPKRGGYFYMNTKLRNAMRSRWSQSLQTAARCTPPPLSLSFPFFAPPMLRDQSSPTGLGRADIIVIALATLSGSWKSDATSAHCWTIMKLNRKLINNSFTKVQVSKILF